MRTAVQQIMLGTVTDTEAKAKETLKRIKDAGYDGIMPISAKTGDGVAEIRKELHLTTGKDRQLSADRSTAPGCRFFCLQSLRTVEKQVKCGVFFRQQENTG